MILALVFLCLDLLAIVLIATWAIGRFGGFPRESRAAIIFCGSVKSLASGAPLSWSTVLFQAVVAAGGLALYVGASTSTVMTDLRARG